MRPAVVDAASVLLLLLLLSLLMLITVVAVVAVVAAAVVGFSIAVQLYPFPPILAIISATIIVTPTLMDIVPLPQLRTIAIAITTASVPIYSSTGNITVVIAAAAPCTMDHCH